MKKLLKIILKTTAFLVVVFIVGWVLVRLITIAGEKTDVIDCNAKRSQALDNPETYSQWAKENPEIQERDEAICKTYNIDIPVF